MPLVNEVSDELIRSLAEIHAPQESMLSIYLDLDNGLGLLQTSLIPSDVWSQIETAKSGIMDGSIQVPVVTSAKDVKAMIASGQ